MSAGQRTVQAGDDAGGERALKAEGIADGEYPLAHQEIRRIAGLDGKERIGRGVDLQHGHVGGRIAANRVGRRSRGRQTGDVI